MKRHFQREDPKIAKVNQNAEGFSERHLDGFRKSNTLMSW